MSNPIYAMPVRATEPTAPVQARKRVESFRFTGSAGEYFRIWIVNVLLTIATLGIYSAWAKVRTRQYFYRNTTLDGTSFEYLADPVKILKGRILIAAILGTLAAAQQVSLKVYGVGVGILMLLSPWFVVTAQRFNARYSAYRNIRFAFKGTVGEAYGVYALAGLVYLFTLGLGTPYVNYRLTKFIAEHHLYGAERFEFRKEARQYFRVYLFALLLLVGFVGLATIPLVMAGRAPGRGTTMIVIGSFYAFLVVPAAYLRASLANLLYDDLQIGPHRCQCAQRPTEVFKLYVVNALAVLFTFGLAVPWAKIRMAHYRASRMQMVLVGDVDVMALEGQRGQSGYGEAAADLGDFDLDVG